MTEQWLLRMEYQRDEVTIAGSNIVVPVEADEATNGEVLNITVQRMADLITRLMRRHEVGEE